MLVLSRKPGEALKIGDNISITLLVVKGNRVVLGVDAAPEIPILRAELQAHSPSLERPRSTPCAESPAALQAT